MPESQLLGPATASVRPTPAVWTMASPVGADVVTPLDCKATYVAGLVRHFVESAGCLLRDGRHLGAFLMTIDGVETIGTVVQGRVGTRRTAIGNGLRFVWGLVAGEPGSTRVVQTSHRPYTLDDLTRRRDFVAHGATKMSAGIALDPQLTVALLCQVAGALDRLWDEWRTDVHARDRLAEAPVLPVTVDGEPVFVGDLYPALADGALPAGEFQHEEWRVGCQ